MSAGGKWININGHEFTGPRMMWFKQHGKDIDPGWWLRLMELFPDVIRRSSSDFMNNNEHTTYCWKRGVTVNEFIEVVWDPEEHIQKR